MKKLLSNILFKQAFVGMAVVLSVYCTFGLSTYAVNNEIFKSAHIFMCLFTVCLYYLFDNISFKIKDNYEQIYKLNVFLTIILQIYMLFGLAKIIINGFEYIFISKIILALALTLIMIRRRGCCQLPKIEWKNYIGLVVLIIISLILMYNPYIFSFKWDGLLYYDTFGDSNLFSISSLSYYRHISQGAGVPIAYILDITFGNTELTIYLINALTMVVGALAFWGIIRKLVPDRSIVLYTILTTVYMWSPWVLGLSGYASIDYFCANWFMIVLYFTVSKQFFLQAVTGLFYTMVKEPAILIYGCLCLGVLVVDIYENKRIKFSYLRYYGMLSVAMIWLITLKFMGMWSYPGSEVKVEASHFVEQAGILYVFNFSWLIWGLIIVGLGVILILKKRNTRITIRIRELVPMIFSLGAFTIFSFIYVTVPNSRYTDIIPLCGYILFAVEILILSDMVKAYCLYMISGAVAAIMLFSSYISIDPISKYLYYDDRISDTTVYTTNVKDHMYGDGIVYNKQALNMEGPISEAIADAINSNREIVIYGESPVVYYFDGMTILECVQESEFRWREEYFDTTDKTRKYNATDNSVSINVGLAGNVESIMTIAENGKEYVYLYYNGIGDELADDIGKYFKVTDNKEYDYCGWTLKGIVFEVGE